MVMSMIYYDDSLCYNLSGTYSFCQYWQIIALLIKVDFVIPASHLSFPRKRESGYINNNKMDSCFRRNDRLKMVKLILGISLSQ